MAGVITWDAYVAVTSVVDDHGFLAVQYDAFGEGESGVEPAEIAMPLGLYARPLDPVIDANTREPDPTQACEVLISEEGGHVRAMPWGDPRVLALLPVIEKGETLLHNSYGQFLRLDTQSTISLQTTEDGTVNGPSVNLQVGPDGFTRFGSTFCKETLDRTGWHLVLPFGRIDLGFVGGMPAPFTSLAGQLSIEVPCCFIESSAIALGPAAAAQQPIALGTATVAALTAVQTALTDAGLGLTAAATALSGIVPGAGAPVVAAVVTLTDAIAAIGALMLLIESKSVTAS